MDELDFRIWQADAEGKPETVVAAATHLLIARATFEAVTKLRPTMFVQLRHRARIIDTHNPSR